ncbi:Si-specific NAD(P)(+) transhydrogenase [Fangia hongkongensis]|uniref:Si-specific NAD(P)(+) transhydrogenase n=1 Tax=Fangia hongkongensis TaxID=270495 RepID=UPI0003A2DB13|nr:Si-specific NAD(P)(+) transhydrogenase [Fangia hongkongensis]MBK2124918.1 Si-specific NAD(P)(+) transhydrogenase [Fangia hongkongensis]
MQYDYDLIVIGSGPAGEGAAIKAAKEGLSVAIVEANDIGGNCTHQGTIPSKALRHAVSHFSFHEKYHDYSYPQMLENAAHVIHQQTDLKIGFYKRNQVDILHGFASFTDPHTLCIQRETEHETLKETYHARYFVIATGSRPYHPKDIDFSHPRILDSDSVLMLKDNPSSITIYGAGVIGCEYASIFRTLKIRVNLINNRERLLSFLDNEIIDALSYHFREQGIRTRHNEYYESIVADNDGVTMKLKSNKVIKSDYLLYAQGRTGNTDKLGLKSIGIEPNIRGSIEVNEHYQTLKHPHIYAAGDVVGHPSLASAAFDQGRFAATHISTGKCDAHLIKDIPTGIYTLPEISSVGKTEQELTNEKVPYEVGHAFFKDLARAQISGKTTGMLKIIFHRDTLKILGIHCFGSQASEIIHIGQAIMSQKGKANSLMYFINTTFNYPTMAEGYRVAALNGLNRL